MERHSQEYEYYFVLYSMINYVEVFEEDIHIRLSNLKCLHFFIRDFLRNHINSCFSLADSSNYLKEFTIFIIQFQGQHPKEARALNFDLIHHFL